MTEDERAREAAAEVPGIRSEILEATKLLADLLPEGEKERRVQEKDS